MGGSGYRVPDGQSRCNEVSFQMSIGEVIDLWNVQIHTLDDTPVIITGIEISVAA